MKVTYSKPLQILLAVQERAQHKHEAAAQCLLAALLLRMKSPSAVKQAVEWLRRSAKEGCADARFALGHCYESGQGVKKNYRAAVTWYKLVEAAIFDEVCRRPQPLKDPARAIFELCDEDALFAGIVDSLFEEARDDDSFEADFASAEHGDAAAQNRLGHRYYHGRGCEVDREEAVYWYRRSAAQGCEAAIYHLATHYEDEKRYKEAAAWYAQYAQYHLARFHAW